MEELEVLYNGLVEDGKYTKSLDEFKEKYNNDENVKFLYDGLVQDGDYTKSLDEFKERYFSTLKKKEKFQLEDSQEEIVLESDSQEENQPILSDLENTNQFQDSEFSNLEMSNLYDDFKQSGILDNDSISEIKDKINLEKEGDFGFLGNLKTAFMVNNPALSNFLGLKWNKPTEQADAEFNVSRNQQINFLDNLPDDKRESLLNYSVDRNQELNSESVNALAFNEILMGKYNSLIKELKNLQNTYKNAELENEVSNLTPEFYNDINEKMKNLGSVISEIENNNSIVENNEEDLSNFEQEVDLLKRNYGNLHNFKEKTRLSTARLLFGLKQKSENLKFGLLDPQTSDFGLAFSELFGEGSVEDNLNLIKDKKESETLNIDALEQISKEYSFLQPNMSVMDINDAADFGQWASEQIAQQLPVIVTIAASGGTLGSATLGVSTAGVKELEMKTSNEKGESNYSDSEIFWASTGYGAAEFIFEKLGTGAIIDNGKRVYKSIASQGLKNEFKKGVRSFVTSNSSAVAKESITEGLTEFFQNTIDRHYLGNKEIGLFDNVGEAMAAGGFMGGVMNFAPSIAGVMSRPFTKSQTIKKVSDNLNKINNLKDALQVEDISDVAKKLINEKISNLENQNRKIITSEFNNIDNMSKENIEELADIDKNINNLKEDFKEIKKDESLNKEDRNELLSTLRDKAISLNEKKESIINNSKQENNETAIENKKEKTKENTKESFKSESVASPRKTKKNETSRGNETVERKSETSEEISIKDSKQPDFVPDTDPKIKKERDRSKEKLAALRNKKNKRAKDIQEMKKEAVKYVKSLLGTTDLNVIKKSEFNTIVQKIRDAKNSKDIDTLVDVLNEQVNKTTKRISDKKIAKLLNRKLKDSSGKGLLSQEAIDVITSIKNLKLFDKSFDELSQISNENLDNDSVQEALEIAMLVKASNSENTSIKNAAYFSKSALEKLSIIIEEGRLEIKELKEADKERKKNNLKEARLDSSRKSKEQLEIQEDVRNVLKEEDLIVFIEAANNIIKRISNTFEDKSILKNELDSSNDIVEAKNTFNDILKQYYKESNFNKFIKNKNIFLDKVHQTYRHISSDLDTLIDIVSKKMSNEFLGGYLHSKISDGVRIAEEAYMKLTRVNKTKIHNKVTEIYGKSYPSMILKLGDLVDSVISDTNRKIKTGIFDSKGNEIELSRGNAMWLYNQYKNPKLKVNFENAGLTEDVMNEIKNNFLTKEDIEFANWLSENFYEDMYSQVNTIFKKIYFRNLPKIDNYSGQIRYQGVDGVKSTDMLKDSGYSQEGTSLFFGSGIDRVNNKRAIDTSQDIFSNLFHYVDSANRFTSGAEIYRDIKEILNDNEVNENFKNYNRGNIKPQINKLVDLSFGFKDKRDDNAIINFLIGAKILSSLALTPKILVTQTISTSLWLTENAPSVIKNALSFIINPVEGVKLMKEIYDNSEYIHSRYNNADFKKIEAAYVAQNVSIGHKYRGVRLARKAKTFLFGKLALANVMVGDAVGMFALGVPYYKSIKEEGLKKFNGNEDKAIKYAIEKFNKRASKNQQSYKSNDRDIMQHSDLGKLINMYGNSPKQYHRSTFQAALQIKRALQGREIKGTVAGNMWKLVLNHAIQGALYQWVGTALVGLLSEDDEEETKLKDIMWGATFGSFAKFFILGDLAQALWDTYQGKPYGQNPNLSPVTSDYAKLFKEIANYKKAVQKEDDVKMEEVAQKIYKVLLDLSGVPATKTESLVNNYKKILDGEYDSDEEMILRLLNYSQYKIDHMDEEHSKQADKNKAKKSAETRKRRSSKKNVKSKSQFDKLK